MSLIECPCVQGSDISQGRNDAKRLVKEEKFMTRAQMKGKQTGSEE